MISTLNHLAAAWWNLLARSVIQDTIFLLVIFLLLYLFRRKHARFLRALTLIGLLKLLIPSVTLPFLGSHHLQLTVSIWNTIKQSKLPEMATTEAARTILAHHAATITWESWTLLLWLGGVAVIFLFAAIQYVHLRTIKISAKPMNPKNMNLPDEGFSYPLFQAPRIESPFVLGIFRPVIILPMNWDTLDRPIQRAILCHERQHIRQHDALLKSVQVVIQALFFYHPLVWLLISLSHRYSEVVCDDAAIQEIRIDPDRYLQTILSFFQTRRVLRLVPSFMSPYTLMRSRILYQHFKQEDAMQPLRKTYS
ncbi:MAG: M56 family metallopeptidase, partial [Calditrichota bacterium]